MTLQELSIAQKQQNSTMAFHSAKELHDRDTCLCDTDGGTVKDVLNVFVNFDEVKYQANLFQQAICSTRVEHRNGITHDGDADQANDEECTTSRYFLTCAELAVSDTALMGRSKDAFALAPIPAFDARDVVNVPMSHVLKNRREWLPHRQKFPLYLKRIMFIDAVLASSVVAVVGFPGSGRTLMTPLILSETDTFKRCRLIVVCASEVAAHLTTRRLREHRGEPLHCSQSVACALGTFYDVSSGSSIVVTTASILMRQLLCDPSLKGVGGIIFDDIHLRDECTEICLAMLRSLLVAAERVTVAKRVEYMCDKKSDGTKASSREQQAASQSFVSSNAALRNGGKSAPNLHALKLRVILLCPDGATAQPLLEFFSHLPSGDNRNVGGSSSTSRSSSNIVRVSGGDKSDESGIKTVIFTLAPSDTSAYSPQSISPTPLYLDETVQWLRQCDHDGSFLCREANTQLINTAERVEVMDSILSASDADWNDVNRFRQYWGDLIVRAVVHYDCADRKVRAEKRILAVLPIVVIIVPDNDLLNTLFQLLNNRLRTKALGGKGNPCDDAVLCKTSETHLYRNSHDDSLHSHHHHHHVKCDETNDMKLEQSTIGSSNEAVGGVNAPRFTLVCCDEHEYDVSKIIRLADNSYAAARRHLPVPPLPSPDLQAYSRGILLCTPLVAQTALPPTLTIGLVVDLARTSRRSFSMNTMTDVSVTEYANTAALRYRQLHRKIGSAPVMVSGDAVSSLSAEDIPCMRIQLIPRAVLHSNAYRRLSTDPTQHVVFQLSFERYVQLYQVLLACEEGIAHHVNGTHFMASSSSPVTADEASSYVHDRAANSLPLTHGPVGVTMLSRVGDLIASHLVAVPASTSNRYEYIRHIFTLVQQYLVSGGHITTSPAVVHRAHSTLARGDVGNSSSNDNNHDRTLTGTDTTSTEGVDPVYALENDVASTGAGGEIMHAVRLQPLGVLTMLMGLPTTVSRLVIFSTLCGCVNEATAIAAGWLCEENPFEPARRRSARMSCGNAHHVTSTASSVDSSCNIIGSNDGYADTHPNTSSRLHTDEHALGEGEDDDETWRERMALLHEARIFFARHTRSDVASVLHLYVTWLSLQLDSTEAADAFLSDCGIDKAALWSMHTRHVQLYRYMHDMQLMAPETAAIDWNELHNMESGSHGNPARGAETTTARNNNNDNNNNSNTRSSSVTHDNETSLFCSTLARALVSLPHTDTFHTRVQVCVNAALYPHAALRRHDGTARLMNGGDARVMGRAVGSNTGPFVLGRMARPHHDATTSAEPREAIFARSSVLAAAAVDDDDNNNTLHDERG